jgi:hypothetical protein
MVCRAMLLAAVLGTAACSATPASFGITGPGTAAPVSFTAPTADGDAAVGVPGIQDSGSPYSNSLKPAGDSARPGNFYGYN